MHLVTLNNFMTSPAIRIHTYYLIRTEHELFCIIILRYSVSFKSRKRNRGVDQWGHSLNEPVEGIVDYKNWRKIARYPLTCPVCPIEQNYQKKTTKFQFVFHSY